MSHPVNEIILENHFEDALELPSAELVKELGIELEYTPILTLEAVVLKHCAENYKKKSMLTHDELVDLLVEKRFEELPEGV
jgi:hypothetical protein